MVLINQNKQARIPTTSFPIDNLNPGVLEITPLYIVVSAEALKIVPSAKAVKEAMKSHPILISAPKIKLPSILAKYLASYPEPDFTPNATSKTPFI